FQGLRHVCFLVNDLDKRLKALGSDVKITLGPVDMSGLIPGMKVAWVADPEGNIIELNQGYCDE
ncbi:VOC family protein, partial [Candidatus Desantisbacteria bacterium]|nr:VOC family protein [Candidatus Desantisbacteria bacterium]